MFGFKNKMGNKEKLKCFSDTLVFRAVRPRVHNINYVLLVRLIYKTGFKLIIKRIGIWSGSENCEPIRDISVDHHLQVLSLKHQLMVNYLIPLTNYDELLRFMNDYLNYKTVYIYNIYLLEMSQHFTI